MDKTPATDLYNLLVTRNLDPEILDAQGKAVTDPTLAELFSFDWKTTNKNYGTMVLLLSPNQDLQAYYGDNLGRMMDSRDKDEWYKFLAQLKRFSTVNMLTFQPNDINRLKYTMQGMAAIKEGLFEGYYGTKKISYSDQPKKTRLMIRHNRDLGENDARFRAIESLFVETADGERFKVPSRSLTHGRMLARHISEGGTPYDAFGCYINQIVTEINTLARFIRASKNKKFVGDTAGLVETAIRHYQDLKDKAKHIISQRGYREEKESYQPSEFTDHEVAAEAIRDMFIEQTLDHRIEEALPLLAKIEAKNMKEADQFESWANSMTEGTWAVPEGPEDIAQLKQLMSDPLPVGPDATNATEQLYDLFGDDKLFNELEELAQMDANADARPAVKSRLAELGLLNILDPKIDPDGDIEPEVQEDLDCDGVMMTKPSNMSSESVDRTHLSRLIDLART